MGGTHRPLRLCAQTSLWAAFPVDGSGATRPPCGFLFKTACLEGGGARPPGEIGEATRRRVRNGKSTRTAADRGVPGAEGWGAGGSSLGAPASLC